MIVKCTHLDTLGQVAMTRDEVTDEKKPVITYYNDLNTPRSGDRKGWDAAKTFYKGRMIEETDAPMVDIEFLSEEPREIDRKLLAFTKYYRREAELVAQFALAS